MSSILDKIKQIPFLESQYIKTAQTKIQVVLHHTVSSPNNAASVAKYWEGTPDRVGTAIILEADGTPYQIFNSEYWAGHIGLKKETFDKLGLKPLKLDQTSIGIEICNWGGLTYKNGKYYNYYQTEVKNPDIIEFKSKFRGYQFFEKYTTAQIQTIKELLLHWNSKYNIPLDYMGDENVFELSKKAMSGTPGIFGHCSFREDKSDVFPQPELIAMLKSLK
jgi:N-acetyl-anhydromuramyl-L-alanine amidase AmpD